MQSQYSALEESLKTRDLLARVLVGLYRAEHRYPRLQPGPGRGGPMRCVDCQQYLDASDPDGGHEVDCPGLTIPTLLQQYDHAAGQVDAIMNGKVS